MEDATSNRLPQTVRSEDYNTDFFKGIFKHSNTCMRIEQCIEQNLMIEIGF